MLSFQQVPYSCPKHNQHIQQENWSALLTWVGMPCLLSQLYRVYPVKLSMSLSALAFVWSISLSSECALLSGDNRCHTAFFRGRITPALHSMLPYLRCLLPNPTSISSVNQKDLLWCSLKTESVIPHFQRNIVMPAVGYLRWYLRNSSRLIQQALFREQHHNLLNTTALEAANVQSVKYHNPVPTGHQISRFNVKFLPAITWLTITVYLTRRDKQNITQVIPSSSAFLNERAAKIV